MKLLSNMNAETMETNATLFNSNRPSFSKCSERSAPIRPTAPHPITWNRVQGPCPSKIKFEDNAMIPESAIARGAPKYIPASSTMTVTGCTFGIGSRSILPETPKIANNESIANVFLSSNLRSPLIKATTIADTIAMLITDSSRGESATSCIPYMVIPA